MISLICICQLWLIYYKHGVHGMERCLNVTITHLFEF